jgi:hypothetical protein
MERQEKHAFVLGEGMNLMWGIVKVDFIEQEGTGSNVLSASATANHEHFHGLPD